MPDPRPVTVDFESHRILARPHYPPVPVGVSIKPWGGKARYWAWGHPSKNNCSWPQARKALGEVWENPQGILFQNAKFDVDVAEIHMGMPKLPWNRVHDTLYLIFLDDPHQTELALKPSAERLLGMKPEEQDAVCSWLLEHQPLAWRGIKISASKGSEHYFGAYIAYAPGDLVGAYADGDVIRTEKLFRLLYKKTKDRGMLAAYDRERRLMPHLLDSERQGMRVDLGALERDSLLYEGWQERITDWVRRELRDPGLNVDSGPQLVDALLRAGKADLSLLGVTPKTGKPKTDKASLRAGVTDPRMSAVLRYRSALSTCLGTFMKPWTALAQEGDGLIHTNWNQVRATSGDGTAGTRTGRLSSTPNFQNIPKEFPAFFQHQAKGLPAAPWKVLPDLPRMRSYIVPWAKDHVLIDRDYSQQEPRILAHFEDGDLLRQYRANPWIDFHDQAREHIHQTTGKDYPRKFVKIVNLGLLYGKGLALLASEMETDQDVARDVRDSILAMYPGLKRIQFEMRLRAASKKPIRTWGGREYYCEPSKLVNGEWRTFDYKLINVLIQGSASDCTKEATIRYMEAKPKGHYFYATVHDETLVSVPRAELESGMECLRKAMESVEFDVPMLSEGTAGMNWAGLKDYDKKGVRVSPIIKEKPDA